MNNSLELRNKNLIKSIFIRILLPALAAGASANLAGIIDGMVVGNSIGSSALGAVNACRPAMQIYGFISEILASGLAGCIAVAMGRNEKNEANRTFTSGMIAALITAALLTVLQVVFARNICTLFADDETLFPLTLEYYRVFLFSVFFILLSEPIAVIMRMDGFSLLSGLVLLLPHFVNAGLDLLFINVLDMGLTGAGIATLLGYVAGFLICCYYFFFKRSYRFHGGQLWKKLAGITTFGLPMAVNMGLISIKLLIVNRLTVANGGKTGMAVLSVLMIAWTLQSLFIGGVKQSMTPMISFYFGNGDYHGVRAVFNHAFRVLMGAVGTLVVLLEIFPKVLPFLFGIRDPAEMAVAVNAIRIFALYLPLESFTMLTITYYTATENKKTAIVLSVLQGLAATVAIIFPMVHYMGLNGVWLSFPIAALVPIILTLILSRGSSERYFRMKGHTYLKEFSIDITKISQTVESVIKAVVDAGFDKITANHTGMAIEELATAAFEKNNGKKLHIDVTIRKIDNTLLVTFADDGIEFDPLQYSDEKEDGKFDNITVLKSISQKIEYGRVIGINKTDISFFA